MGSPGGAAGNGNGSGNGNNGMDGERCSIGNVVQKVADV